MVSEERWKFCATEVERAESLCVAQGAEESFMEKVSAVSLCTEAMVVYSLYHESMVWPCPTVIASTLFLFFTPRGLFLKTYMKTSIPIRDTFSPLKMLLFQCLLLYIHPLFNVRTHIHIDPNKHTYLPWSWTFLLRDCIS